MVKRKMVKGYENVNYEKLPQIIKEEGKGKGKKKESVVLVITFLLTTFLFLLVFINFAYSQTYYRIDPKEIYAEYESFFPEYGGSMYCNLTQNFLVYVDPFEGCKPEIVRSDLLEEQPVLVFCKLKMINLNPLLQSIYIKNAYITLTNKSHPIVTGAYFHFPYLYEAMMSKYFSTPGKKQGLAYWDNLGYAVIQLAREPNERKIPERVDINASARIYYTSSFLFGIDRNQLDLPKLSDEEFEKRYNEFEFFNGKGFVRLIDVSENSADVLIYKDSIKDPTPIRISLSRGIPQQVGFWGFFCDNQNFEIELVDIDLPKTKAKLIINGERYVAGVNEKLDNGCVIKSIDERELGGKVRIGCFGKEAELELELSTKVKLRKDNEEKSLGMNQYIKLDNNYYYLIFTNSTHVAFLNASKLIDSKEIELISEKITRENKIEERYKIRNEEFDSVIKAKNELLVEWKIVEIIELKNERLSPEVERAWEDAKAEYNELFLKYKSEKDESGEFVGASSLFELYEIAKKIRKNSDAVEILNRIIDEYSGTDSRILYRAQSELKSYHFNLEKAETTMNTVEGIFHIELKDLYLPRSDKTYVRILIDGVEKKFGLKDEIGYGWVVNNIGENYVDLRRDETKIRMIVGKEDSLPINNEEEKKEKEEKKVIKVKILEIRAEKIATVVIRPPKQEMFAESNFSIHIGIEKRLIQIGPEKTKKLMEKLNKTIKTLNEINDKLTKVIQTWKKACYIGGTALFVKTFFQGLGGKATARKLVMDGIDGKTGWKAICQEKVEIGEYKTVSQCLRENSPKIEKEISTVKDSLKEINNEISSANQKCEEIKEINKRNACFFEELIKDADCQQIGQQIENDAKQQCKNFVGNIREIAERGIVTREAAKDLLLQIKIMQCKDCSQELKSRISESFSGLVNNYIKQYEFEKDARPSDAVFFGLGYLSLEHMISYKTIIRKEIEDIKIDDKTIKKDSEYFIIPNLQGFGPHYVVIERGPGGIVIKDVYKYKIENGKVNLAFPDDCNNYAKQKNMDSCAELLKTYIRIEENKCNVPIADAYARDIHFYKSGQWKSRVKYMPLTRILKGLYVYVPDEYKVKSYLENGMLNEFWLCNVGENGIPDMAIYGNPNDDMCSRITSENFDIASAVPVCYDEPSITVGKILHQVQQCVADANVQKRAGKSIVRTQCSGEIRIKEVEKITTVHCEDFMSARDCWLLFNLCDPVLCPPSRCDLGGRYPVDNVVQSGIIGSLALCLPNFEGGKGVLVPVCLTGINAGIDGLISILNATKDCLNESLQTGKTVGICDMIMSIYLCEFMWKELTPFIRIGIPSIIEKFERKGGGEYAFFSDTWRRTEEGMSYFINYYGTTAIEAFKIRSTAEVGTMLCKKFIGIRYPNAASLLEEISKPESPYQIFATVTENAYSEVTVPPQSHYKVFYHIYAGKDQGVYYSIYLKSPTQYPGVISYETWVIDTGFIAKGSHKQETKDFTAPKGYKQLCVNINAREYCGFQVVSTSFAVNWLQDRYVEDQLKEVKTSRQCMSGTPSIIPTSTILNLQAGLEQAINPAIYRQGITRMCSSRNPGVGVNEADWAPSGYCDDPSIKCWVYLPSIRQAIKDVGLENATIAQLESKAKLEKIKQILGQDLGFMEKNEIDSVSQRLKEKIEYNSNIIKSANEVIDQKELKKLEQLELDKIAKETQSLIVETKRQVIRILDPISIKNIERDIAKLTGQVVLLKYYEKEGPKIIEEKKEEEVPPTPTPPPPTPLPTPPPPEKFGLPFDEKDKNYVEECSINEDKKLIEFKFKETINIIAISSGNIIEVDKKKKTVTVTTQIDTKTLEIEYEKLDEIAGNVKVKSSIEKGDIIANSKQLFLSAKEKNKEKNIEEFLSYFEENVKKYIEENCIEEQVIQFEEAFLVSGNESYGYDREGKTIEFDDKNTKVCVILVDDKEQYYNNDLVNKEIKEIKIDSKKVKVNRYDKQQSKLSITWEVITPVIWSGKDETHRYKAKLKTDEVKKDPRKKYCWIEINNRYYQPIVYRSLSIKNTENQWCITPASEKGKEINGTFWYRAILKLDEKTIFAGPMFAKEMGKEKQDEIKEKLKNCPAYTIYSLPLSEPDSILIPPEDPCENNFICAGVLTINPNIAMRISRKSKFCDDKEYQNNKLGCELIRLAESFYNVPYVGDTPLTTINVRGKDYSMSELGLGAKCGTFVAAVIELTFQALYGHSSFKEIIYVIDENIKNVVDEKLKFNVGPRKEKNINEVFSGDMLLITGGVCFIYKDENNNEEFDAEDSFIAARKLEGKVVVAKIKDTPWYKNNVEINLTRLSPYP